MPPTKYRNSDGSWEISKDSIVTVKYEYRGREMEQVWKIKEINNKELKVSLVRQKKVKKE